MFLIILSKYLKNKKILLIDFDLNKQEVHSFLGIKKYSKLIRENNYFNYFLINKKIIDEEIINKYFTIKIKNNINLISGLDLILNNLKIEKNIFLFQNFLNKFKNNYDLILIDIGSENNYKINNCIYKKSDLNIFLTEGNLIGINKFNKFFKNYKNYLNNFKIIINKNDKYSIDKNILNKVFDNNIIGEIKYQYNYSNLINKNFKNIIFNNKIKKEYKKIIGKLNI